MIKTRTSHTRLAIARPLLSLCALATAGAASAADFNAIGLLTQAEFRAFSEDVASAVSYKGLIPSEGLGITGFDLGLSVGATEISNRDILRKAAGGADIPKQLPVVGVRAVKGLPFDIDIGLVGLRVPGTDAKAVGGELRWAFIGGNVVLPAVAVRAATMKVSGVNQLDLRSDSIDLSISKGFAFVTPYGGVGQVRTSSSAPGTSLRSENFTQDKVFAGVNFALGLAAIAIEADKTGDATSYGAKFAIRW